MGAKNYDFVQFERSGMDNVRELIAQSPTAANIFVFLSKHMNKVNAVSCSQNLLQEVLGKSRTTVQRAIKHLKDQNFLTVLKQGNSYVYVLNPSLVWASHKYNRKYCAFEGKMLISQKENEAFFKQNFNNLVEPKNHE